MSKLAAFRGWVRALYIVPVLAIFAIAFALTSSVFYPAGHHSAGMVSAASLASWTGTATPAARGSIQANYAALPLAFEQNQGQTDAQVKYMARGDGYTLFLTANDAVFSLRSHSTASEPSAVRRGTELRTKNPKRNAQEDATAVVRMQLTGANLPTKVSASDQMPGKSNYFLGNDPSQWHTDVAHYARVSYQDVYPGVNLAFHGAQRQTEFDFVVAPGANPAPIGFHFTGAQGIKTDDSGNLVISSAAGDVLLHKPVAYQEQKGARQPVDARFVLKTGNQVAFELGNYDHSRELVIDPSVSYAYSTYLGGSGNDEGRAIAFDSTGAAYVTGQTASPNFPQATGSLLGTANVFVTKIAPDESLDYSTYIGGTGAQGDSGNAIAVNQTSGVAFIAGGTTSTNFPATAGAFQTVLHGTTGNAFVCELGIIGTRTYCTYLGGTGTDTALGIALASDGSGDVYVVGKTSSADFPTQNPLQAHVVGSTTSGFVTKLNSTGTAPLLFSTYLGGGASGSDLAGAVAVDSSNNVYVTGQTFNSGFPVSTNAVQKTCGSCSGGNSNAFVTVINPAGTAYVYSTFLGGSVLDAGDGIAVDSAGNAYVTGVTTSSTFPTTSGAYKTTYVGATDAFVTKLNPTGTAPLVYSTFLGGTGFDTGASIAVDGGGNAYVTGQTASSNFPTASATQAANGGGNDAFVSELNTAGSQLVFSTYLGGSGDEDNPVAGNYGAIAVDSTGANIYVTGNTASTKFPNTSGAFQTSNGGGNDAFVVKYTQPTSPSFTLSAPAMTTPSSVSPGNSATASITVTPNNGFSPTATVTLACSVAPAVTMGPTCSVTTATGSAPGTLTVSTTGPSGLLQKPAKDHSSRMFYAMFMPIGGIALLGFGSAGSKRKRKKILGFLLFGLVLSGLLLMPACGGSSTHTTGNPGTPTGTYTITVTGTATGATQAGASPTPMLTVN